MKKIDWDKVWLRYFYWFAKHHTSSDRFIGRQDQERIQSLVEAQLKRKKHAK